MNAKQNTTPQQTSAATNLPLRAERETITPLSMTMSAQQGCKVWHHRRIWEDVWKVWRGLFICCEYGMIVGGFLGATIGGAIGILAFLYGALLAGGYGFLVGAAVGFLCAAFGALIGKRLGWSVGSALVPALIMAVAYRDVNSIPDSVFVVVALISLAMSAIGAYVYHCVHARSRWFPGFFRAWHARLERSGYNAVEIPARLLASLILGTVLSVAWFLCLPFAPLQYIVVILLLIIPTVVSAYKR
jgi:hypothetical protein